MTKNFLILLGTRYWLDDERVRGMRRVVSILVGIRLNLKRKNSRSRSKKWYSDDGCLSDREKKEKWYSANQHIYAREDAVLLISYNRLLRHREVHTLVRTVVILINASPKLVHPSNREESTWNDESHNDNFYRIIYRTLTIFENAFQHPFKLIHSQKNVCSM